MGEYREISDIERNSIPARGKVIDHSVAWTASGTGQYAAVIEFTTLEGQVIQGLAVGTRWSTSPPRPNSWGVSVRYDPDDPYRFIAQGGGASSCMTWGYLLWPVIGVSTLILVYVIFVAPLGAALMTDLMTK